jgi:hypothetical protein
MPDAEVPEPAETRQATAPSVVDTTELRWFVPGPLPADISVWFTGSTGVAEERCDTYLIDARREIGVKRRHRETLELKVRRSLDGPVDLGGGLTGSLEVWRKWSPADDHVEDCAGGLWIDVQKSVVKRRFSPDGTEVDFSSDTQVTGAGCDVEIAGVTVGADQWWTFAFAAFGPPPTRRDDLLASWDALNAPRPCPEPFGPRTGQALGYPEWLSLTIPRTSTSAQGIDPVTPLPRPPRRQRLSTAGSLAPIH